MTGNIFQTSDSAAFLWCPTRKTENLKTLLTCSQEIQAMSPFKADYLVLPGCWLSEMPRVYEVARLQYRPSSTSEEGKSLK